MNTPRVKICKECKKVEGEVEFYGRYRSLCKKCHNKECKEYRKKNKPKLKSHRKPGYWWYWDMEKEPRKFPKSLPGL